LFELVRDLHRMMDQEEIGGSAADETLAALRHFDTVLGVLDVDAAGGGVPSEISALAEARDAARKARDYARADALRDDLAARGWVVEDTAAGPRLKRM